MIVLPKKFVLNIFYVIPYISFQSIYGTQAFSCFFSKQMLFKGKNKFIHKNKHFNAHRLN